MSAGATSTAHHRRSRAVWVVFLAGPVLWYSHFWLVYLLAEAICAAGPVDARWLGVHPLTLVTVATTAVAAGLSLWFTVRAWRRWRRSGSSAGSEVAESEGVLSLAGVFLGFVFSVSILFVGVPALFLQPC